MGIFGGKQTTTGSTSSTQRTFVDPRYEREAYGLYDRYKDAAENYAPVFAPDMPDWNADQIAARDQIRALQGQSTLGGLKDQFAQYQNYQPLQVSPGNISTPGAIDPQGATAAMATASLANRGDIRDIANQNVNAAQFSQEGLERILAGMDPSYTQAVRDTTLQDINRSRKLAQFGNEDIAARSGAFGGSRHGVLGAETNRAYGDIAARTSADLNLNYYNTALGQLQSDLGRRQQAGMFNSDAALRAAAANQGIDANVALQNSQLGTQTSIANAGNQTQAGIASAGFANQAAMASAENALRAQIANQNAGLTAGMANQTAGYQAARLGLDATDRQFDVNSAERDRQIQDIDMLNSIGNQAYNRDLGQNEIDYMNDYNAQQAPLDQLRFLQEGFQNLPQNPTTTGSSDFEQVLKNRPGLIDWAGLALKAGGMFAGGG